MTESLTLDTEGAADRVGLSPKTLTNWRISGKGPPHMKLGKAVRYRAADLDAWMASKVISSTSQSVAA